MGPTASLAVLRAATRSPLDGTDLCPGPRRGQGQAGRGPIAYHAHPETKVPAPPGRDQLLQGTEGGFFGIARSIEVVRGYQGDALAVSKPLHHLLVWERRPEAGNP